MWGVSPNIIAMGTHLRQGNGYDLSAGYTAEVDCLDPDEPGTDIAGKYVELKTSKELKPSWKASAFQWCV